MVDKEVMRRILCADPTMVVVVTGSLATVCKKFGNFSESLAAIYMTQVLNGLQYLHEQGKRMRTSLSLFLAGP